MEAARDSARRRCGLADRAERHAPAQRLGRSRAWLTDSRRDFDFQRTAAARTDVNLIANAVTRRAGGHDAALQRFGAQPASRHRGRPLSLGALILWRTLFRARCAYPEQIRDGRRAALSSYRCWATTNEIFDSEEPCAIAMMFTFSRPRTLKVRPAMPDGAAHFFSHYGHDGDVGVHRDVFDHLDARDPGRIAGAALRRCVSHRTTR